MHPNATIASSLVEKKLKVAYLAAGAGEMYCGTCLRDAAVVRELRRLGHDAVTVPLYASSRQDRPAATSAACPIQLGGMRLYAELAAPRLARLLRPFASLLDSSLLLRAVSKLATSVDAHELGRITVSVLAGEAGPHEESLQQLANWVADRLRPDIVDLSNSLLAGLIPPLRRRLSVPIVCTLSGEDAFLDELPEPWRAEAYRLVAERLREADLCISFSRYYRQVAAERFALPAERIALVPLGTDMPLRLDTADRSRQLGTSAESPGRGKRSHNAVSSRPAGQQCLPTIGFLARICPAKGPHLLCEAYELLRQAGYRCRLRIAGYVAAHERRYFDSLAERLRPWLAEGTAELCGELDWLAKLRFFDSLDLFCLPAVRPESKGLPVLEAWSRAVPAVLSGHGSFPELAANGGAVLFEPGNAAELAEVIGRLLADEAERSKIGAAGQEAVARRYRAEHMASATVELYRRAIRTVSRR